MWQGRVSRPSATESFMTGFSPTIRLRALAVAACMLTGGLVAGALGVPADAIVPRGVVTSVVGSGFDADGQVSNILDTVDGRRAIDIATNAGETLMLLDDGSLVTTAAQWRIDNWVNTLGGRGIVDIESGYAAAYAILSDGSAATIDPLPTNYPIATATAGKTFTAISGGRHAAAGLTTDGDVVAWGDDTNGDITGLAAAGIDGNAKQIDMGLNHGLALLTDGSVVGWGYDAQGSTSGAAAAIDGGTVEKVVAGSYVSFAILGDGTVAAWGSQAATLSASIADTADGRFIADLDVYFDDIVLTFTDGTIAVVPSSSAQSADLAAQIGDRRVFQVEVGDGFSVALLGGPSVTFSVLAGELPGDDIADVVVTIDDRIHIAAGPYLGGTDFSIEWDGVEVQASTTGDDGFASEVIEIPDTAAIGEHIVSFIADGHEISTTVSLAPGLVGRTPIVTGTVRVNETLTAVRGKWTVGAAFSYSWLRDGKTIASATASTYTLTTADLGKSIQVKVTGTKQGFAATSKTSVKTGKVGAGRLVVSGTTVSGTPRVGETLTVTTGTGSPVTPTFSYQWYANGKPIAKATKSTYLLTGTSADKLISVGVTAAKTGYTSVVAVIEHGGYVERGTLELGSYYNDGVPAVGKALKVIRYLPNAQTPGVTVEYQWLRDGSPILGATKSTYKPTKADLGRGVSTRVLLSRTGYTPDYFETYPSEIYATQVKAGTVKITGTPKVGSTLTATATGQPSDTTVQMVWQKKKGSKVTSLTVSDTYTLQAADKGFTIFVEAHFSKIGYASSTAKSPATKRIG